MADEQRTERPLGPAQLFSTVITAYTGNLLRAGEATLVHAAVEGALPLLAVGLRDTPPAILQQLPPDVQHGLDLFWGVSPVEYDAFTYVGKVSFLVYFTTLFDTFIQDTIEFLLCVHPSVIGESAVSFERVLKAGSREEILNVAIKAKVKELGFDSFSTRLRWLRKRFGLDCKLTDEVAAELAHFSDVRNSIVHDQGFFDFFIDGSGSVALQHRACPRHPTVIADADLTKAKRAFTQAVVSIAHAIFAQVLKQEPSEPTAHMLEVLRAIAHGEFAQGASSGAG